MQIGFLFWGRVGARHTSVFKLKCRKQRGYYARYLDTYVQTTRRD